MVSRKFQQAKTYSSTAEGTIEGLTPVERSEVFKQAAERRNDDIPLPLRKEIIALSAVMRGAAAPDATGPLSEFSQHFSLPGLQKALADANDDELAAAYEKAMLMLQGQQRNLANFLRLLATAFSTAVPGVVSSGRREALRDMASVFSPSDSLDPGAIRLFMTLVILTADQHGEAVVTVWRHGI